MDKKKNSKNSIATNLRLLMTLNNLSEGELSRQTNIKQPIIHRLVTGANTNPTLATIKPIADFFSLSISQLIGENEQNNLLAYDEAGKQVILSNKDINESVMFLNSPPINIFGFIMGDKNMEPIIPEGAIVFIDPTLKALSGNYIAIKNSIGFIQIRQLVNTKKNICTINAKNSTILELSKEESIIGVVIRTIIDKRFFNTRLE